MPSTPKRSAGKRGHWRLFFRGEEAIVQEWKGKERHVYNRGDIRRVMHSILESCQKGFLSWPT